MRLLLVTLIAICAGSTASAQDTGSRLNLVCMGAGSANKATSAQVFGWNGNGNFGSANIIGNRAVPYEDQVNLWVEGGEGRVRLPRTLLPPLHGGEDGWFELKSVKVTSDAITGSVGINFANHPKLHIDRRTGRISIAGKAGDYAGVCTKFDPESVQRAF